MMRWILIFFAGLIVGAIIFAPVRQFRSTVENVLGGRISIGSMSLGSGLGLGFGTGGLIAVHLKNASLNASAMGLPPAAELSCDELTISPHLSMLFLTKLKFGVQCIRAEGKLSSVITSGALFKRDSIETRIEVLNFDFGSIAQAFVAGVGAVGSGELQVSGLNVNGPSPQFQSIKFKLKLSQIRLPELKSPILELPVFQFSQGTLVGQYSNQTFELNDFSLGASADPLEIRIKRASLGGFGPTGPSSGQVEGRLRIVPDLERNLDERFKKGALGITVASAFGKRGGDGFQPFKKTVNRDPMWFFQ